MATIPEAFALALQYHQSGRLSEAEHIYREILKADPHHADSLHHLGAIAYQVGKPDAAVGFIYQALGQNPWAPPYHNSLGLAYQALGKLDEAIASYRQALRLKPDFAEVQNNLGLALAERGEINEAIAYYRRALQLKPDFAEAHNNLGNALSEQGSVGRAVASYEEALRLRPEFAEAHNNLGDALKELGKFDVALSHFEEAVRLKPTYAQAYYNLTRFVVEGRHRLSEKEFAQMEHLVSNPDLGLTDQSLLHFSLGDLLDRHKAYDEAFTHYRQANDLRKRQLEASGDVFDADNHRRFIDALIATFNRTFFEQVSGFGVESEAPVFIVGMPRSGTTLVEQILASHPEVFGAGELREVAELARGLQRRLNAPTGYPDSALQLGDSTIKSMATIHLRRLAQIGGDVRRIVDKMPENYLHLGLIAALFPKARVIHCQRDPVDTCLSCYFQNFKGMNFVWSLKDLGAYYRQYERLMAHWREVLPLQTIDVRYEALVADQEAVSRVLLDFCGLDWDDRCLDFHRNPRAVQTASTLQVRRPVYRTSVGRWRRYESHLRPLIQSLVSVKPAPRRTDQPPRQAPTVQPDLRGPAPVG